MKLLFIGDIVGEPGRRVVHTLLPKLRIDWGIHFVVANGENSAGGAGITPKIATELYRSGVDVITTGDHLWDQKDVVELLEGEHRFLRPANYPVGVAGSGARVYEVEGLPPVGVMNLQGRTFMAALENPFLVGERELALIRQRTPIVFVDFHAEATSEKIGFARMVDGRVSGVVGTHTHVQTADDQVFPGGTAFLCDAGFTGAQASVLGRDIDPVIQRFLTQTPQRFTVAKGDIKLMGALIEIDESTGRAISIRRVAEPMPVLSGEPGSGDE